MLRTVRRNLFSVFFLVIFLAWSGTAGATSARDESYFALGEIVVSDTQAGPEAVGSVETIDAETIESRGAQTLNEALQLVPGLNVRTGADGVPRIDIRGLRTRHVLLLLDGIPFNSTFDGQFDPMSIPVEHIAEIKVTSGGSSVLYGPGGNGGVINIITKKGNDGLHGAVAAEAGEEDSRLGRFTLGAAGAKTDFFVSGSASERDGFRLSDDWSATAAEDGGLRENSDMENRNLFANFGYALSEKTQLALTVNLHQGEFGKPPVANFDKNDPFTKSPKFQRVDDQDGYAAQLAFSHVTQGPLSLRGWVYFNRLDVEENRYDDASFSSQVKKGAFLSDSTTEAAGASLQLNGDFQESGSVTLGLIAQNEDWQESGFEVDKNAVAQALADQRDLQLYTLALEYVVSPLEDLGLVLGYGQHFQKRDGGEDEDDFSYLLGTSYGLQTGTRLWASHSRKIRFASIKQLFAADGGNQALEAERTLHYELGVEQQLPAATLVSLTGYVIEARDFIEKNSNGVNTNFEDYRFRGFDLAAENRSLKNLMVRAVYSYLDSEDRSSGSQVDELQYRPRDKFTLEGRYDFAFGLSAQASLLYVGHQFFYDDDGVDPLLKKRLDDYAVVNMKLTQTLLDRTLDLYVGADNLFDENYEQSFGFPQPGRTVYGGVAYRF